VAAVYPSLALLDTAPDRVVAHGYTAINAARALAAGKGRV